MVITLRFDFLFVRLIARHDITDEIISLYATEITVFTNGVSEVLFIAFEYDKVLYIIFPY